MVFKYVFLLIVYGSVISAYSTRQDGTILHSSNWYEVENYPEELKSKIERLLVHDISEPKYLNRSTLVGFNNLNRLDLVHAQITGIEQGFFSELSDLEYFGLVACPLVLDSLDLLNGTKLKILFFLKVTFSHLNLK